MWNLNQFGRDQAKALGADEVLRKIYVSVEGEVMSPAWFYEDGFAAHEIRVNKNNSYWNPVLVSGEAMRELCYLDMWNASESMYEKAMADNKKAEAAEAARRKREASRYMSQAEIDRALHWWNVCFCIWYFCMVFLFSTFLWM